MPRLFPPVRSERGAAVLFGGRSSQSAQHGVYVFRKLGGSTANPYGVFEGPVNPIHVDQLPPPLRSRLKEVRFDKVSFDESPVFQPAEHVPCHAEDTMYTDMNGRLHPFGNAEEELSPDEHMRRLEDALGPEDEEPPL